MTKPRTRRSKAKIQKPQETNVDIEASEAPEAPEANSSHDEDHEGVARAAASAEEPGTATAALLAAEPANEKEQEKSKDDPEEQRLDTDIVFQCGPCRTVLGDTLADYEAHLESNTLSLRAARNVVVEENIEVSQSGFDAGCTFKPIKCTHCKSTIGRVYASTTPALDSRRDTYTFDTRSLISYQLGSCRNMKGEIEMLASGAGTSPSCDKQPGGTSLQKGTRHNAESLELHINNMSDVLTETQGAVSEMRQLLDGNAQSLVELRSNQEQAQNMMLLWEERFRRLEECEHRLQEMSKVEHRLTICEGRVGRIEAPAKSVSFSPASLVAPQQASQQLGQTPAHQLIARPPSRLKTSPSVRRPTPSPARTPLRRAVPSPAGGTPSAKRRRP